MLCRTFFFEKKPKSTHPSEEVQTDEEEKRNLEPPLIVNIAESLISYWSSPFYFNKINLLLLYICQWCYMFCLKNKTDYVLLCTNKKG